jgi:membrane-associated phospholipid phosphatase
LKTAKFVILFMLIVSCPASVAYADSFAYGVCKATKPALAAGIAAAYFASDGKGFRDAARTSEAIIVSYGAAQFLQRSMTVNSSPEFRHTFPSVRTTVAFAAASSLADVHPDQKWIAYSGAALVGWSTLAVKGHTWKDVLAGAALGTVIGKWSIASEDGFLVGRVFKY